MSMIQKKFLIMFISIVYLSNNVYAGFKLDNNKIYEIKNPDSNCRYHDNYDYFTGEGKLLFHSDEKKHIHYLGIRDGNTNEIVKIQEVKYRVAKNEERVDSDTGYRIISVKYYDKNKNLLEEDKESINGEFVIKKSKEKTENSKRSESVYTPNPHEVKKQNRSFKNTKTGKDIDGVTLDGISFAFSDEATYILDDKFKNIKVINKNYEDVSKELINDGKKSYYLFTYSDASSWYRDLYDENFNIVKEKIASVGWVRGTDYIYVHLKDSGIYKEDNYYDEMYTILCDKNLKTINKFDGVYSIDLINYNGKIYWEVATYGFPGTGGYINIYDDYFNLLKDKIYDIFTVEKYASSTDKCIAITDDNSTKIYSSKGKMLKDLYIRIMNKELVNIGIKPFLHIGNKYFVRTDNDKAYIYDESFNCIKDDCVSFYDLEEDYFSYCTDTTYGLMDYELNKLVEFKR